MLHDTLEDTGTSYGELEKEFGRDVATGVQALTKRHDLPKERRMMDSLGRIKGCDRAIWMVKLSDRITNMRPAPPGWDSGKKTAYRKEAIL